MKISYFTICSSNYLAYALTLAKSFSKNNPHKDFYIFLADRIEGRFDPSSLGVPVIESASLDIGYHDEMAFRYSIMEFNTAIKPFCIKYLMDSCGAEAAVYLDPDILVLQPLEHVEALLGEGRDLVLTPHMTAPLHDGAYPDEIHILQSGAYNLGFGAFANTRDARLFLDWWASRLETDCIVDLENGLFVDQKFVDLAPSYVPGTAILHHPGYNAAYWNLAHRDIACNDGCWRANGELLHFFHFSGVVPGNKTVFSKHQDRFSVEDLGGLRPLFEYYIDQLAENGHDDWCKLAYAYDTYTDGTKIPDVVRRLSRRKAGRGRLETTRPFEKDFEPALRRASEVRQLGPRRISNIMYQVWLERKDLQAVFPLTSASGQAEYCNWYYASVEREYSFPAELLASDEMPEISRRRSLKQQAVNAVFANLDVLRPFYSRVPESVRGRVRETLLKASGQEAGSDYSCTVTPEDGSAGLANPDRAMSVSGYFRAPTGVGEGARRMVSVLDGAEIGLTTRTIPMPSADLDSLPWIDRVSATPGGITLTHMNADQMLMIARWLPPEWLKDRYHIGYWAWELGSFPQAWTAALDSVHEVWVPSRFVADAVAGVTDKPVTVVPHPVFAPANIQADGNDRTGLGLPEDGFLFLTAFDCNSYITRKNPVAAIQAFQQAFPLHAQGRPFLVLKMHGRGQNKTVRRQILDLAAQDPHLIVIDRVLSPGDMQKLQACCDAFVSLHRSEGFGLNLAEMMAMAKPVIATNYSGNTDFMTGQSAALVDYQLIPVGIDEYVMSDDQVWADPSIDHAASFMSQLVSDEAYRQEMGRLAYEQVTGALSQEAVRRVVLDRLSGLSGAFAEGQRALDMERQE